MTTFQDREKGYENKFAHDQEKEFKVSARRNKLVGLWVAELLGKEGESAEDYANALVVKSIEKDIDKTLVQNVLADLEDSGSTLSEKDVCVKMEEFGSQARQELSA